MPGVLDENKFKLKIRVHFVTLKILKIIKIVKLFINYIVITFLR
jgi:hypothetical protein